MKLPKVPQNIVIKVIAIGICGLVAVSIPHAGVSACTQVAVMEIVTVSNLQGLCQKLKKVHGDSFLRKLGKHKPRRTDKDKE